MDRTELETLIAELEAQEAKLRFPSFSNTEAIALGAAITERARSRGQAITVAFVSTISPEIIPPLLPFQGECCVRCDRRMSSM